MKASISKARFVVETGTCLAQYGLELTIEMRLALVPDALPQFSEFWGCGSRVFFILGLMYSREL